MRWKDALPVAFVVVLMTLAAWLLREEAEYPGPFDMSTARSRVESAGLHLSGVGAESFTASRKPMTMEQCNALHLERGVEHWAGRIRVYQVQTAIATQLHVGGVYWRKWGNFVVVGDRELVDDVCGR